MTPTKVSGPFVASTFRRISFGIMVVAVHNQKMEKYSSSTGAAELYFGWGSSRQTKIKGI